MSIRIFGDGLDALILGYSLSKNEISFEWVTTKNQPGGYFAGARNCAGNPIDLGMVLLEPNSFNTKQIPLTEYDGEEGHSGRPFLDEAYSFLEELFGESRLIQIEVKAKDGSLLPDYFISDSLDCFWQTDEVVRNQLLDNLNWLLCNPDWHPKNKQIPNGVISGIGIASYYKRIYGEEIYEEFFRGYLENLLGEKIDLLPANLHRRAWAPLYWPETLLGYSQRETTIGNIFQPKFTRPSHGSVSKWVESMNLFVANSGFGEITKVEKINADEYSSFSSAFDFAFLEHSIFDGHTDKQREFLPSNFIEIKIIHFCVDHSQDNVVFLNGNENACFRYSTESTGALGIGGITLEFGDLSSKIDDENLILVAMNMTRDLGFEPKCLGTLFKGKLPLSQPKKSATSTKGRDLGNKFTFHNRTAMSINDNIVRGAGASVRIKRLGI